MDIGIEESDILGRLAVDDLSALGMIWTLYASDLLGYLVSMLCSRHDAEDALQEVFVTIARKRSSVATARRLKPYLFRLSRNVALNRIKRNKRLRERHAEASQWLVCADGDEQRDERTQQLETALRALPEKQRVVVVLKSLRDKTFREIGEMLGISENTAGSRYRYGMARLRALMREGLQ